MKIKLHYTLLIFIILGIICGILKDILIIYFLIMAHEIGHLIFIKLFKRKINNITLLPLGGIIDYHNNENMPLYQDFLINAGGLLINILLLFLMPKGAFFNYNKIIIMFNILPIYPLDGGRILEVVLCKFIKFRIVIILLCMLSIALIAVVFIYNFLTLKALSTYLIFLFLLLENIKAFKERRKKYQLFLLKKYLNPNSKLKKKKMKGKNIINSFYKGANNVICVDDRIVTESSILKKYFNGKIAS